MYFNKKNKNKDERKHLRKGSIFFGRKKSLKKTKNYKLYDNSKAVKSAKILNSKKTVSNKPKHVASDNNKFYSNVSQYYIPKHMNREFRVTDSKIKTGKVRFKPAIAFAMAGIMSVSAFLVSCGKKNTDPGTKDSITTTEGLKTASLDSLGEKLPKDDKKSEYTKVSGDFNVEDVVVGSDGRLYVDAESARNAERSGSSEIDTKGGSLYVADNGKVYTQEHGYEVVDENGNVIDSGTGTPSGGDDGIDYVECPCNYYDDAGNLVHSAGEFITPSELDRCRQYYHTSKPQGDEYVTYEEEIIYYDEEEVIEEEVVTTGSNEEVEEAEVEEATEAEEETYEEDTTSTYSDGGVTNPDGTYTIYGVTYLSYADYQQYIINGGAGYGYIDGVIQPIGDYEIEEDYQYTM